MDLKELIDDFTERLTQLQDRNDQWSNDKQTVLHGALTSLNTTSIALSDLLIGSDLQTRADFEPVIRQIVDDSETIVERLRDLLEKAVQVNQQGPSRLRYIHPDRAAVHPLSIFFQSKRYGLRRKQIAHAVAVLSLLKAAIM